jgi:uncharacterized protein (TIGR02246 family)
MSPRRRTAAAKEAKMTKGISVGFGRAAGTAVLAACLLFILSACATGGQGSAAARDSVAAAVVKWTTVFVDDNPDLILALYDDEGILWGTLSPTIAIGKTAIRGYFDRAYKALPGHKVTFGEQKIRVYGDTAINSGYYTFSFLRDGQPQTLPARYSFVYRKRGDQWLIVDHHSSAMPPPPK